MKTDKFYITEEENKLIASSPENECWICDLLSNNVRANNNGIYITKKLILENRIQDHIQQIVKRKIVFVPT